MKTPAASKSRVIQVGRTVTSQSDKEAKMITADLNNLELTAFRAENEPSQACRSTFPTLGALGTENSAMVYFELDEGHNLGRHTDSVEEILLVLEGTVEVTVGSERGQLSAGQIGLVPTMVPHDLRNIGKGTARVVGFFGAPNIVATFDNTWQPTGSNQVDTAKMTGTASVTD
jgi:quercetin dioxygenase-like cupin family protein